MATKNSAKAESWQQWIDEQTISGLSVRAFCQQSNLKEQSFYRWRNRLKLRSRVDSVAGSASNSLAAAAHGLLPVEIVSSQSEGSHSRGGIQIVTPSGYCIRMDHHLSVQQLTDLLGVLESQARRGASC